MGLSGQLTGQGFRFPEHPQQFGMGQRLHGQRGQVGIRGAQGDRGVHPTGLIPRTLIRPTDTSGPLCDY
jgi:hypothetical protein